MSFASPFGTSTSKAGHGSIVLELLPPNKPTLRTVSYQYPLKLVAPDPLPAPDYDGSDNSTSLVHTVFLLTYGGGIVAGDTIDLDVQLGRRSRLVLLTQGSTKIFKTLDPNVVSRQQMTVHLQNGAALIYLPDPVQPFAHTAFSQSQIYRLENEQGSLCFCDWVTSGRSARGENWDIFQYKSRNEVWTVDGSGKQRLLLRDNLLLDSKGHTNMTLAARMDGFSVFGTLIVRGPLYAALSDFFIAEFEALPRIGGRNWGDAAQEELSPREKWRQERIEREKADGLIWSAANVRGFVLVKFASREVEGSRHWLRSMITEDGSVVRAFGQGAILCMK